MEVNVKLEHTFTGHDGPVYAIESSLDGNGFYTGSGDKLVSSWNLDLVTLPTALINVGAIIYSVIFIEEFNHLLIGEANGGLHIVDLDKKEEIRFITHHQGGIFDIKYSLKNHQLYTASADGSLAIWNIENFSLL